MSGRSLPVESGDASEDVDCATLNAVLVLEGHVAVLDLDRDRHQHRVAGNLHEISPHIKRHQVDVDFVADDFFEILELDRRGSLQFGKLLEAIEFLGLQILIERGWPSCSIPPLVKRLALLAIPICS